MSQHKNWSAEANAARLEDLQWMADTGETLTGAAARLGITTAALWKWCDRHDQHALYDRLTRRESDPKPTRPRHTTHRKENQAA